MAQLMPLSLASVKSRLVLPFWYQLTRMVPDKGPLNGCVCLQPETSNLVYTLIIASPSLSLIDHPIPKRGWSVQILLFASVDVTCY